MLNKSLLHQLVEEIWWLRCYPIRDTQQAFQFMTDCGKRLAEMHMNYDSMPEYPLEWIWTPGVEKSFHVKKMRFTKDRSAIIVNESLTLAGIPPRAHEFVLGEKSALEWIVDQYQIAIDPRSGIVSDPNNPDDPEYIVRHICRVVYVSVETVRIQREMAARIDFDDFVLSGPIGVNDLNDFWTS